jgi:hypothetical protein
MQAAVKTNKMVMATHRILFLFPRINRPCYFYYKAAFVVRRFLLMQKPYRHVSGLRKPNGS